MEDNVRNLKGIVLRHEKGSMEDGDGMRTVIYMKGCPLHCWWCSTPESHRLEPEVAYTAVRCVGCGRCVMECPQGALSLNGDHRIVRDYSKCNACFHCVEACPYSAHKIYGREQTVEEVVELIAQDQVLYFFSGGGVTFGGGECLGQADFVSEVMKICHNRGINTAMETTLVYPWTEVEKVLPHVDVMYVDMKIMDEAAHRKYVGGNVQRIRDNLRRVDQSDYPVRIRVRVPTIPTINDTEENMKALVDFCRDFRKIEFIELLPYHRLGVETYRELERTYQLPEVESPSEEKMIGLVRYMNGLGGNIPVITGGTCYR